MQLAAAVGGTCAKGFKVLYLYLILTSIISTTCISKIDSQTLCERLLVQSQGTWGGGGGVLA